MLHPVAVYVDEAVWPWRGRVWCHLLADTPAELHGFAIALGVRAQACQRRAGQPWRDHYDLPAEVRDLALARGAIAIDRRQTVALLRRLRARSEVAADG